MGRRIPGIQFILTRRETGDPLVIGDPQPVGDVQNVWTSIGRAAIIGIFLILFGAFLYIARVILLPTFAAAVISLTLAPVIEVGRRRGIPPWISGVLIVVLCLGVLSLAATALAGPVSEWIGRAPEIGATIKQKFAVLEQPLSSLRKSRPFWSATTTCGAAGRCLAVDRGFSCACFPHAYCRRGAACDQ